MNKNIIISNPEKFEKIKNQIIQDGFDKLHIISDFDKTLTHAFTLNNKPIPSLISVLRNENYLIDNYSEKAHLLFNKYHPIEVNNSINLNKKKEAMDEWWDKHLKLLIKSKLNKKDILKSIKSRNIRFRKNTKKTLEILNKKKVPFIILSANGLGDESIVEIMNLNNINYQNISIISNKFYWDKDGYAIDYQKPVIHVFNKDETSIKNYNVYKEIKERKNVILLGDSIGDVGMIEGFKYDNLLKIGFLNLKIDENLDFYKEKYDVIVLNDGTMDFFYNLICEIQG